MDRQTPYKARSVGGAAPPRCRFVPESSPLARLLTLVGSAIRRLLAYASQYWGRSVCNRYAQEEQAGGRSRRTVAHPDARLAGPGSFQRLPYPTDRGLRGSRGPGTGVDALEFRAGLGRERPLTNARSETAATRWPFSASHCSSGIAWFQRPFTKKRPVRAPSRCAP